MSRLLSAALLALALGACGRHAAAPGSTGATAPAITAAKPPAPATDSSGTAVAAADADQAAAVQESPGEDPEDRAQARSDVTLEHLAALPADAQLPTGRWKPGVNYNPVVPAQPTGVAPGKVEVLEVFWLGCPHCYALEPFIQSWLKTKPDYIQFVRVPVMWGPAHRAHAKLFYTLQALGRSDLFEKAFDTIQQQHQPLVAQSEEETQRLQQEFATQSGIKPDDFLKAYNSFSVNSELQRAEQLTQRYQVQGVPLVVVNGKYTTDVGMAGSPQNLLSVVNDLAAAEHANRGRS